MKKILMALVLVFTLVALCSCSKVSQKYADKINEAAKSGEHYTLADVLDDLGDEAINKTDRFTNTGVVIAVKGVKSKEDLEAKWDADEEFEGLIITFAGGKAMTATYGVINEDAAK